jgi:hypothetical protein
LFFYIVCLSKTIFDVFLLPYKYLFTYMDIVFFVTMNLFTSTPEKVTHVVLIKRGVKVNNDFMIFDGKSIDKDTILNPANICPVEFIYLTPRTRSDT